MRRMYRHDDILVRREDLRAFAWSAPMRDLAPQLNMSDVGLRKLLSSYGVAPPPQGYWNKLRAGKPVPSRPEVPPRRPGEIGRLRLDARFAKVVPIAAPMSSAGPFASPLVPEDLEELRALEIRAIGRATVPKSLDGGHGGLRELRKQEERRRLKFATTGWEWHAPKFDNPVARRRLRILNGVFLALAKRGHGGHAYERDGEIYASAEIGDTHVGLEVCVYGSHRQVRVDGYLRPAPDLPLSTPLMVRLRPSFDNEDVEAWHDDKTAKIEEKLAAIVASIIVAGEARFRRSLREAEERIERERVNAEKRKQEKLAALNQERVSNLLRSGELLREAQAIRSLVAEVREAIAQGAEASAAEFRDWERWAFGEAGKIDPVRSGQFMTHFKAPTLPETDD